MNILKNPSLFCLTLILLLSGGASALFAQLPDPPAPRENRLLNGTRVLIWNDPAAPKVTVNIRIHSGAAFDPLGKEGLTQLVTDSLFPNTTTREFFADDLNGTFGLTVNHDYVQISTTADADKFLAVLEALAAALNTPQFNKETHERLRAAQLERIKAVSEQRDYRAGRDGLRQLFGNYPYGRPVLGTSESLARIDHIDVAQAFAKFFTADNATIVVVGNVTPEFTFRAAKRLLGGWLKADRKIPPTFAQPEPVASTPVIKSDAGPEAARTVTMKMIPGRSDRLSWAFAALAQALHKKKCSAAPGNGLINYDAFLLRGVFSVWSTATKDPDYDKSAPCGALNWNEAKTELTAITPAEFEATKAALLDGLRARLATRNGVAEFMLDLETYKLGTVREETARLTGLTLTDVQNAAAVIVKAPTATLTLAPATTAPEE